MTINRIRAGTISSAVLFLVVFASQESGFVVESAKQHGAALGLLLFLLPGIIGSLLSPEHKIMGPLAGVLLMFPVCLLLFNLGASSHYTLWYQFTYLLSAVFWCAFGALGCYFVVEMFTRPLL
ncbi:inner membrane protein YbjM [Martelella alba]|nr:inner membrane protein YbjM [Martelella alba]